MKSKQWIKIVLEIVKALLLALAGGGGAVALLS